VNETKPQYDAQQRRRAVRGGLQRGCSIYIASDELEAAGIDPAGPAALLSRMGTLTRQRARSPVPRPMTSSSCVYCGDPGRLLVGRGVVVCPSHRELVRLDPAYVLRSSHGITRATRPETRPAQGSALARDDHLGT
jgi:hypothetical protein